MSPQMQKRLAVAGAIAVAALFIVANAHLLAVAMRSQPDCVAAMGAMPAKRAC